MPIPRERAGPWFPTMALVLLAAAVPAPAALIGDAGPPCVVERLQIEPAADSREIELTDEEAGAIQACLLDDMKTAFAGVGDPAAEGFTSFATFSKRPYRTAAHGSRFVMNYANAIAATEYGKWEKAGVFPVGSVLVKSSFGIDPNGVATVGPLALMEKMKRGFAPLSGDWKYSLIEPDGEIVGVTGGEFEGRIAYCNICHRRRADDDYLYFLTPEQRVDTP